MTGINRARGEVVLLVDAAPRRLCLTLGALAEIETALDVNQTDELSSRLQRMVARDVIAVLAALLRGGGEVMTDADVAAARIDPSEAADAIARAFELAVADGSP